MALEGALVGYAVTKLLDQVLTAIRVVKDHGKNLTALRSLLERLQPLVSPFCTSGATPPPGAVVWLKDLEGRLKEANLVVQDWKTQNFMHLWKTIRTARKVINVTAAIKDLLLEAGAVGLLVGWQGQQVDAAAEQKKFRDDIQAIGRDISQFQGLVQRMQFSLQTRKQFDKPVDVNIYGYATTITGPGAFAEIKGQADIIAASYSNLNDGSSGVAKVSTTPPGQSSLRTRVRETIFGGDEVLKEVKRVLLSDENDKWVGLWSMGGAGKTLTAQRLYCDPLVQQHFLGGSFWLTVGKERRVTSLVEELYEQITGRYDSQTKEARDHVIAILRKRQKVLLVLDDVWSSAVLDDLDDLDLIRESYGNRILVTTRNVEILDKQHAKKWSIPMLSPLNSWQLFCLHAFNGADKVDPSLETCARQIVDECGGLPLALKVIGGAMAGKRNRADWNQSLRRLRNADTIDKDLERKLYDRLQLSVDDLPGIHKHLKDCFYYFAAFPEDLEVRVNEDLLGLWMADGIVGTNSAYPPEDEAFELLGWLIARSLIELDDRKLSARGLVRSGNVRGEAIMTCKIHDVLRDLARRNLQHDIEVHERVCLYQAGMGLKHFPEAWTASVPQSQPCSGPSLSAQRLSVMSNELEELPAELTAPRLRVLLMNENNSLRKIPENFLVGFPQLRVLDLSFTAINEMPAAALSSLKLLELLNLSNCHKLLSIPESIQQLTNLKDLQLSNCTGLVALPDGLRCLTKLQALNLLFTNVWGSPPARARATRIIPLTRLVLSGLNDLLLLENLKISSTTVEFAKVKLKLLRNLRVEDDESQSCPDIGEFTFLETLKLGCSKTTTLPHGMKSLSNLKSLELNCCSDLTCLPKLDELPVLSHMLLTYCDGLTHLPKSFGRAGAFPSLQVLDLTGCYGVNEDDFPELEPGAMPQLVTLFLTGWIRMRLLPTSLQFLTSLRFLDLSQCFELVSLENAFPSTSFPDLEILHLNAARALTRLPESLALARSKLVKIDLQECPAADHLPKKVQQLKDLGMLEVVT